MSQQLVFFSFFFFHICMVLTTILFSLRHGVLSGRKVRFWCFSHAQRLYSCAVRCLCSDEIWWLPTAEETTFSSSKCFARPTTKCLPFHRMGFPGRDLIDSGKCRQPLLLTTFSRLEFRHHWRSATPVSIPKIFLHSQTQSGVAKWETGPGGRQGRSCTVRHTGK